MSRHAAPFPFVRTLTLATLIAGASLAVPLLPAHAAPGSTASVPGTTAPAAQITPPGTTPGAGAAEERHETVGQRISELHAALKITPTEQAKWTAVARVMRANAADQQKLVAAMKVRRSGSVTALEDLETYQKFVRARAAGLHRLIPAFASLYHAMPAAQRKNADLVFATFGRKHAAGHG